MSEVSMMHTQPLRGIHNRLPFIPAPSSGSCYCVVSTTLYYLGSRACRELLPPYGSEVLGKPGWFGPQGEPAVSVQGCRVTRKNCGLSILTGPTHHLLGPQYFLLSENNRSSQQTPFSPAYWSPKRISELEVYTSNAVPGKDLAIACTCICLLELGVSQFCAIFKGESVKQFIYTGMVRVMVTQHVLELAYILQIMGNIDRHNPSVFLSSLKPR